MSARNYVNNAPSTTLTGPVNASVTAIPVTSLAGFPTSYPYTATIDLGTASAEVVLVTGATGSTPNVTRNYDGQGAFSHAAGATFDHTATALDYREANQHVNASSGVHGISGSVVGTTDTQSLSGKTLVNAAHTGDAANPALVGKATTVGGKTLSLRNSSNVEKLAVDDAGNLTGAVGGLLPTGAIVPFAGVSTPTGFLWCDGSAVSRTTYAALLGAVSFTATVDTTSGAALVNVAAHTTPIGANWTGYAISGAGIPAGTIVSTDNGTSLFLSQNATATATGVSVTLYPYGAGNGTTTFNVPDLRDKFVQGASSANALAAAGGLATHAHPLSGNGRAQITASGTAIGIKQSGVVTGYSTDFRSTGLTSGSNVSTTVGAGLDGTTDTASSIPPFVGLQYIIRT